jgi:flagellar hook-length control protein FliK
LGSAVPGSAAPGSGVADIAGAGANATALADPTPVTQPVTNGAAAGSPPTTMPPVHSGGALPSAGHSGATKPDDAVTAASAFAAASGVAPPASSAPNAVAAIAGPAMPQVAGEAGEPVAVRIARAARDGDQTLTLELHPADLGRVEVRLSFHADGVGVQMTLDKPETFAAFSHNRAGLEQQLAQSGISLGGGGLDLRLGQQGGQPESERRPGNVRASAGPYAIPSTALPPVTSWASRGLVDIVA